MKPTNCYPFLLLTLCMLWACENRECDEALPIEISAYITGNNAATLTRTEIASQVTGANYDRKSFEEEDVIKITKGETASLYKRQGKYWRACEGETPLTTSGGDEFTAVFPQDFTAIQPDQTTIQGFFNSNKLQATATSIDNHLAFGFSHAFAKITLVISYAAETNPLRAEIEGGKMCGGSGNETVSLYRTSGSGASKKHSYTGIVNPDTYSVYTIRVTTGSDETPETKSYTEKNSERLILKQGHNYQFSFTTSEELILTGVTVSDFDTQEETDTGSAT